MKPIYLRLGLVMVLLVGLTSAIAQQGSDSAIRAELQRRIPAAPGAGARISVAVQNGIVTLSGTVPSLAQKFAMINIARRTVGVKDVVDMITVVPSEKHSDAEIERAVRTALSGNLSKDELNSLNISVRNGVVVLSGALSSSYSRQIVGVLTSWVPGVVDVRNQVVVHPAQGRSDLQILADVRDRLHKSPFVASYKITVGVVDGVVTLNGIVDSYLVADQAESIVRFTPGVVDVRNMIYVRTMGS